MSKKNPADSAKLKHELIGISFITIGIFSLISLIGLSTGVTGDLIKKVLSFSFGIGAFMIPLFIIGLGYYCFSQRMQLIFNRRNLGSLLLLILSLAIYHHFKVPINQEILPERLSSGGGIVGGILLFSFRKLFGIDGTLIILFGLFIASLLLVLSSGIRQKINSIQQMAAESIATAADSLSKDTNGPKTDRNDDNFLIRFYDQEKDLSLTNIVPINSDNDINTRIDEYSEPTQALVAELQAMTPANKSEYTIPSLNLLQKSKKYLQNKFSKEIADNARLLEQTLENFGVNAKIVNTCQGPSVTRYELEPAAGVKVSKIVNLSDDLALKLAAPGIRIEAPIPGKAAIGIEVPNKIIEPVNLRDVLESDEFRHNSSRLSVALGKDIAGQSIIADLGKMPHLLVAGATGSGKSVCINTIIVSILFNATPAEVKLVLIDPKVVELSNYNGIPHLLTPVVTDSKKAASALNWAVLEMERRYELFAQQGVREVIRYNQSTLEQKLPWIVIIIDELADLMMVAPVDVEDAICRLAQKARAAGIHLVLATQRPSVDVITGTIKANIPSRISFAVSSQIDSRTILDMAGAEKLLGKGDMLFYPVGASKPIRIQGAFIGESEIEKTVSFIKQQAQPEYSNEITSQELHINKSSEENKDVIQDELLEDAVRIILETGQASVSMLQRKFRIGYTRAARLIDTIEEMKIIGPNIGSKPREITMTSDQVYSRYFKKA